MSGLAPAVADLTLVDIPAAPDDDLSTLSPAQKLNETLQAQLKNAVDAVGSGLLTYESLRNVSEAIGGEYGDRVIFELVQNAHDAHEEGDQGSIFLKLVIHGPDRGDLYIANKGQGFAWKNVNAIRNIGVSSKTIGQSIGNKGFGFRSVETLTDDPRIYSQAGSVAAERFTGYCFRFADFDEVKTATLAFADEPIADHVARVLPRYLAAVPVDEQPEEIRQFAREGYATVVHLPLTAADTIAVAREQVAALVDLDVPLLLFLDRLARVSIEVDNLGVVTRRALSRHIIDRPAPKSDSTLRYEIVSVGAGGGGRYLVARRAVDRNGLLAAVEASIAKEPQLARWRDWQGEPSVGVAVPLSSGDAEKGRTYNFLPMAAEVPSKIRGHVDAPFYASIDRRRANFDLPLNAFLLDELAVTALLAATELKALAAKLGRNTIFDLAAWAPDDLPRFARASKRVGVDWRDCEVVPAAGGDESWTKFRNARIWQEQGFKLLRVRRLVKAGVPHLADPGLQPRRLERLRLMMVAVYGQPTPDERVAAAWIEAVALSLEQDQSGARTWASLYEDARKALASPDGLRQLGGKRVLKTQDGTLQPAGAAAGSPPVFVRRLGVRDDERAPLPPANVASRFSLLDDTIPMAAEVVADFIKADLLRPYDALQALAAVQESFSDKPAPKRRESTLKWAFDVWRAEGAKSEKILRKIDLHVETNGGWRPASKARFSDGWTPGGRRLTTYLAEAAPLSADCQRAAEMLLLTEPGWAPQPDSANRKTWTEFLRAAGVRDGLPLIDDPAVPVSGTPSWTWETFRRRTEPAKGRSQAWSKACLAIALPNPQTIYSRRGALWRFPGQVEHRALPVATRHRLAELILLQLANEDQRWLKWRLGRYERFGTEQNERELPTPAAVFIATQPWMSVEGDADRFEKPGDLWASKDRKQQPPRYVDRPREALVDLIEAEKRVSAVLFDRSVGLRDWLDPAEVIRKLESLALGSVGLEPRERVNFRRTYQRVWTDACKAEIELPPDMPIATVTAVGYAVLAGNPDGPARVFVTGDALRPETKAVIAAGQPILELSDEGLVGAALERLQACEGFEPLGIDRNHVDVLVDGVSMVPNLNDPLIASDGLEWLPEAAVLANEVLGRELERQISSATIEQRLRRVRLRHCEEIRLAVGGIPVDEALPFFAFPDDDNPTLVVGNGQKMTWPVLADAAPYLSVLLDGRMRSLETLLLRMAAHRTVMPDPRQRPTEEELARALNCKVDLVRDHALALRADGGLLVGRLLPIVACATDLETARSLGQQLGDSPLRSKVLEALRPLADRLPMAPEALLDEIAKPDLAQIRRALGLEYGRFNHMLDALGQPMLSNESELQRLFETWKLQLAPDALERLRRHFWPTYQAGNDLQRYVALRTLSFLEFQPAWIADREELFREDVATLLDSRLAELIGDDVPLDLEPLAEVRERSAQTLQRFIDAAAPTVGAWCHLHQCANPWSAGAMGVLRTVSQQGLLDFVTIDAGQEIATLLRAGAWPEGMPHSVDAFALGLDPSDLLGQKKREQAQREQAEIARRSIDFGDNQLDTRAPHFAQGLVAIAQAQMADGEWLTRSRRRFKLVEQAQPDGRGGGGGGGGRGGQGRRNEGLPDDVRRAMGFASEYLASCYLRDKHKERYDPKCWVSSNRGKLEIDWDGDDDLGYDFKVLTADTEWRYEVKSNLGDAFEFEFTHNEMRKAAECASDVSRKYRILYVPFVFQPDRWRVMELPNPMSEQGRRMFETIGASATRLRFGIASP
ncbi:MAG: sacsin N-terminal ATP-binding-like domain-containing protein [Roseateles sp.]